MSDRYGKWLSTPPKGEEVVITGISGRLPESNNVYEFRDNLFAKKDMITSDGRRWLLNHSEVPQRNAKIFDIDQFDPGFFGIHYRQAHSMDPMTRKFLETAIEAIMDAGVNPSELEGSKTGVFVGTCFSETEVEALVKITEPQKMGVTGTLKAFIPHRVSYYLKLEGPSYVVDTACSSSSNAVEHALRAIRTGECDNAIVGGANIVIHPGLTLQFFRSGMLSSEGKCKVFDQDANGYVRGEAIASIFLQKRKNAKRVYAQILYSKMNFDGFKPLGITFPSSQMQQQLITETLETSGLAPEDLAFLEAHGTGTQVGDPEEVEAIDGAIGKKRKKVLLIGSTKSNIGHSEPVSGLCSLIKVIIAMETGRIPPNIHLKKIKQGMVGFEEGRLKVVTETTDLEGEDAIIGLNNFGFGGSNCHLVVRRFDKKKVNGGLPDDDLPRLICVSGRSENAVLTLLNDLNRKPIDSEYVGLLHDLFESNVQTHIYRGYTIVSKNGPLKTSVRFFNGETSPLYIYFGKFNKNFQYLLKYLQELPVFKTTMERIDNCLLVKNTSTMKILTKNEDNLGAFVVQLGIVDILHSLKLVAPNTEVHGDDLGKIVCDYYYNRITLEEAIISAYHTLTSVSSLETPIIEKRSRYLYKSRGNLHKVTNLESLIKRATILNISDDRLGKNGLFFVENACVTFLETLGVLYERGHNLHLHRLYPKIEYPVSRATPMISPMIKWAYRKSWYTYRFQSFTVSDATQKEYQYSYMSEENKFLSGHVIDGRNLFPATGYLYIVWQTFIESNMLPLDAEVVFENCRFVRAVAMGQKANVLALSVFIQRGSGNFEIMDDNSLVVTGRIYAPQDVDLCRVDLAPVPVKDEANLVLEQDEIYRELYLRGYNYSGMFKGLVKCNVEADAGLVKWEQNWITFMDNMLQLKILQMDTRLLYVPTGIRKLVIEPSKLSAVLCNPEECVVPVNIYKELDLIKTTGVEITGLQATAISRKKSRLQPVLEKYEFVPNTTHLSLEESLRVNIQIILENSMENNFKSVEICEDSKNHKLLLPLIAEALEDVPLVNPDLIVSTKTSLEQIPGVKVADFSLTPESGLLLIVGTKILEKSVATPLLKALAQNGFILSREEIDFVPKEIDSVEIVCQHSTENEKLILFKKRERSVSTKFVEISETHFEWVFDLQNSLKHESNVVVFSYNQQLNGIIGLVNCIRREPGGHKVRCFFMMDEAPEFNPKIPFYGEQIKKNLAVNVFKDCQWGTYRHLVLEDTDETESEHCYVNTTVKGDLSSLKWLEGPLTAPSKKDAVQIYIYYSSLNFKDIMLASGRISADSITSNRLEHECLLGFEYSGRDLSGRRVMGIVNNAALSTLIAGDEELLWTVPETWSLEDAATVPVVYSTVIYALLSEASLKPGASILIHSATGGVGLAALNLCLHHGCKIFVTVGTQEKRDFLRQHYPLIPDNHIGNSRDTSFEEMIKIETDGRGVDIVLNSLSEEKLKASVRCLARGGRLLEIGKFDLANNNSLSTLLFEKECSYHGVMLNLIFMESSEIKTWLFKKIYEGMRVGFIKPLPRTVFGRSDVETAFRFMATGKHIGKVLINVREEEEQKSAKPSKLTFKGMRRFNCAPEKVYIIIGGLGGVGMELADWLMLRGAKNLILVSSSGVKTGYQTQRIRIWKSHGVSVHISKANVTTVEGCISLVEEARQLGRIDGIFNLAAVLKDALFEDQNEEKFRISMAPKSLTTMHLDEVTRKLCPDLRYFVVFSSVSCGRGNAGQSNYGMANSIMERICEKRKREGLPALAVQWGAIGEVGLVAKMQKENKELVIGGTLQQKISSCFEVLDKFLKQEHPVVASMVVAEKQNKMYESGSIAETIANVLGIKDLKTVNLDTSLAELGMDSMMGVEVIQKLEKDYEIYLTTRDIRTMTFARLLEFEKEKINDGKKAEDKIDQGINLLLQYIPDSTVVDVVTQLPSQIRDEEKALTIFVFPGIEGVLKPLAPLTDNLNARVFGVHYSYHAPEDSVEEAVENILPHIEARTSRKQNFFIIGYSFGTIIGLETVALLEKKGYKCHFIAIEGAPAYIQSFCTDYFQNESENELQTNLLLKILELFLPRNLLLENKEKFLECETYEERLNLVKSIVPVDFHDRLDNQAAVALYKRFKFIFDYKFSHAKIRSPVNLIKAKVTMFCETGEDYSLSEFCEQPVQISVVDGDHASILNQADLSEIVNKLL